MGFGMVSNETWCHIHRDLRVKGALKLLHLKKAKILRDFSLIISFRCR